MKEVHWHEDIPKAEFIFAREGQLMRHNYVCAVCKDNSGVQFLHTGVLQPCWDCQKKGYFLIKKSKIRKIFEWFCDK